MLETKKVRTGVKEQEIKKSLLKTGYNIHSFNLVQRNRVIKLKFSNLYIFAIKCRRPFIFQTVISVRSYNISLKFQRFTQFCCRDVGIRKLEFVATTQFLIPFQSSFVFSLKKFIFFRSVPKFIFQCNSIKLSKNWI